MNTMSGMIHNAFLVAQAEKTINRCLENGMFIYLQNPDGTQIRLRQGMGFITMEIPEAAE